MIYFNTNKLNMSKLEDEVKLIYNESGKVIKGLYFFKPNLKNFLHKINIIVYS